MANIPERAGQKGVNTKAMGSALEFAPPLIIQKDEIDVAIEVEEKSGRTFAVTVSPVQRRLRLEGFTRKHGLSAATPRVLLNSSRDHE
ncbi:MAG: hypothetical protein ACM3KE_21275 [Hyphomicrobiales bacterium]